VANDHGTGIAIEMIVQADDIESWRGDLVSAVGGHGAWGVATQEWRDNPESGFLESWHQESPSVRGVGETVQAERQRKRRVIDRR
jgi:hypothetical protein